MQSLFNSLGDEVKGKTIGLGGDGRYFNKQAAQIILKLAAAAGIKKAILLCICYIPHMLSQSCRAGKIYSSARASHTYDKYWHIKEPELQNTSYSALSPKQ